VNTKELLREICNHAKANGVKLTRAQARAVLSALREISIETCKRGDRLILRNFLIIEGVMTSAKRLPNGKISEPRLKITVKVSEALKENFRVSQKELKELKEQNIIEDED
jgi:nucleoid DNA-binding protein